MISNLFKNSFVAESRSTIKVEIPDDTVEYEPITDILSVHEIKKEYTEETEMQVEELELDPEPQTINAEVEAPAISRIWTDHLVN